MGLDQTITKKDTGLIQIEHSVFIEKKYRIHLIPNEKEVIKMDQV